MRRHRHQEFIRFLNAVERAVPAGRVIHDIVDNYANGSNVIRDGRSISHRHRLPGSMRSRASLQPTKRRLHRPSLEFRRDGVWRKIRS
jgi:hypothetical protein